MQLDTMMEDAAATIICTLISKLLTFLEELCIHFHHAITDTSTEQLRKEDHALVAFLITWVISAAVTQLRE